jgi:preprotein translocase subunit SecD
MRTLSFIFLLFVVPCVGRCVEPRADNTLRFYVVSDEPIAGGRYVNTPECPNVGYVTNTPNLVITRLQSVSTNASHVVHHDKIPDEIKTDVVIQMFEADAKRFADLTRQNIGRRILMSLGDRPLMAPVVQAPIESGGIQISVNEGKDIENIAAVLKRFVRNE